MCSSVSCVSTSLESGRGMDKLFKVLIWGLPCKCLSRVSLQLIGILGLSVLLLAVEVWLVVDCMSSLDVESVSVSVSSGLELVEFCDSLVGLFDSLDTVGAGVSGLDSGMASVFGLSLTSVTAGWPFMVMSWVNMLTTSSGEYDSLGMAGLLCVVLDGLGMVGLLCTKVDGLVRLLLYLFWDVGLLR